MGKILPILIVLLGLVVGGGAGMLLRPAPAGVADCIDDGHGSCDVVVEDTGHGTKIELIPTMYTT